MQINFSGGGQSESSALAIIWPTQIRLQIQDASQCALSLKIVAGGVTMSNPINGSGMFYFNVAPGDAVSVVYDGQNHPAALCNGSLDIIGNINSSVGFLDSTTALGAAASYIGSARITSSYGPYSYFNALAYADVAGTLYIDWSADSGSTWQTHSSTPVAAGTTQSLAASLVGFVAAVQFRARYVNGAGAQTVFRLATSFTVS